jgi:hypothetical protein
MAKEELPGLTKIIGSAGTGAASDTYDPGAAGKEAYWLIVLGTSNATVSVVQTNDSDDLTDQELLPTAQIPIRSIDVTVTAGKVMLVLDE